MSWFVNRKKELVFDNPVHRFICLVCAHNESAVISQIVKTLRDQKYPKELYDIVVIADNCKDNTAQIASGAGANVWERFHDTKKSKGYALEWAFQKIWDEKLNYDAVVIFDADNLVSPNFLYIMDQKMQNGAEVIQGYLDSKNPNDTWITKAYAFSYWATNRIFQLARELLGLSAQLGGTGMCISTSVLKEHPWGTQSMTEDLEYVVRYVLSSGQPVCWAHEASVYDEKPLKLKSSFVQRTRWARGHIECAVKYSRDLAKATLSRAKSKEFQSAIITFDVLIYLIQPARMVISIVTISAFIISFIRNDFSLGGVTTFFLIVLILYYGIPLIGAIQEKKSKSLMWIVQVHIFAYSWLMVMIIALFSFRKKTWNKTEHTRSIDFEELNIG